MFVEIYGKKYIINGHIRTEVKTEKALVSLGLAVNVNMISSVSLKSEEFDGVQYYHVSLANVTEDDVLHTTKTYIKAADQARIIH